MTAALLLLLLAGAPSGGADAHPPVRAALEDAVRQRLRLGPSAEVAIAEIKPAEPALLKRVYRVASVELPPGERGVGRVTARVAVIARAGAEPRETWVVAKVTVRLPTVVTTRRVGRGDTLGPADVTMALMPLDEAALGDPGLAVGRVARQVLAEGEAIRAEVLTLPTLVRRGDRVTALVTGRGFRVQTAAEALARGALGAEIPVRVTMTGRVVTASIVGPGQVEVVR
ncbi:MAG: flagella basal body P-ring formation protein FlgA [Deltaproteobacteria bacterium HGW-Deltaproteobacteria-14]|jgi:flagella basal body P-ring formation protein FlgA|nr:MAG: flagella basal body P-ring formation protein FlgA [Deltaproteobacteria bacterium HGW-Deltaproteobacteria-14]